MRPRHAILLALLVVFSGCGGVAGPGTDRPAATTTETTNPTSTTSPTSAQTPTPTGTPTDPCATSESDRPSYTPTPTPKPESTPTPTPTPTPAEDPHIEVVGGTLDFDPMTVWQRVEDLTGTSVRPPETVVITDFRESEVTPHTEFERSLGFGTAPTDVSGFADIWHDRVYLDESLNRTQREAVLAHEFYHFVYLREDTSPYGDVHTYQEVALRKAIFEGAPDYLQQAYWRDHMDRNGRSPAGRTQQEYEESPPVRRVGLSRYHFGQRYIADRIDSSRDLEAVYENPPRTTEELIHRLPPGSEPPVTLDVTVRTDDWNRTGDDTRGELFVRHALQVGVDDEAAASAAAGWGNDRLVEFTCGDTNGFAWALRWDDAANATEFAETFREYLDARGSQDGEFWTTDTATFQLYEPDDETVVVVVGPREFVQEASVSTDGDEIEITAP